MSLFEQKLILTPSTLNRSAKSLLEQAFAEVWVEGEISNLARPASGHIYFSLKDAKAQIRCALFKPRSTRLQFRPENGDQVLVQGKVSLYEVRGDYQLIASHLEPAGEGALRREYERLKAMLKAEGLFDPERKKPLPSYPKRIGVVTSPSGAAIKDVLKVLGRRWPLAPVRVYPTQVQGLNAGPEIVAAIKAAGAEESCDVLIVTRGGGSLEDLWCFNDEQVVRAVAACPIPVVSAVGHEVDVTLVDFVSDLRAPTPSAAAEMVSPSAPELLQRLSKIRGQLRQIGEQQLRERMQSVDWLARHLRAQHPKNRLDQISEQLQRFKTHLPRLIGEQRHAARQRVALAAAQLDTHHPKRRLLILNERSKDLHRRLGLAMDRQQQQLRVRLESGMRMLELVSPLDLLSRGYAIVQRRADGQVIKDAATLQCGDQLTTRLADGSFESTVEGIERSPTNKG